MASKGHAEIAQEILQFLTPSARVDLKATALQYFLGLTGTSEGKNFIRDDPKIINSLYQLTFDSVGGIAKDAFLAFINLSADEQCSWCILNMDNSAVVPTWLKYIVANESEHADAVCMIFSNITHSERCCQKVFDKIKEDDISLDVIANIFCHLDYNAKNKMHYLGPLLSNLTQLEEVRCCILKTLKSNEKR